MMNQQQVYQAMYNFFVRLAYASVTIGIILICLFFTYCFIMEGNI